MSADLSLFPELSDKEIQRRADVLRWQYYDANGLEEQFPIPVEVIAEQQLDATAMHQLCPSPDYLGGIIDRDASHLHPLRLAVGLAKAAIAAGVSIYEGTRAQTIAYGPPCKVTTPNGQITADY